MLKQMVICVPKKTRVHCRVQLVQKVDRHGHENAQHAAQFDKGVGTESNDKFLFDRREEGGIFAVDLCFDLIPLFKLKGSRCHAVEQRLGAQEAKQQHCHSNCDQNQEAWQRSGVEDHAGKSYGSTNDQFGKCINGCKFFGVSVEECLDLPIGIAPTLNKVDILGNHTDQPPNGQHSRSAKCGIHNVLQHLNAAQENVTEHCGNGEKSRHQNGNARDKQKHQDQPRVINERISLDDTVCDEHGNGEHKALSQLVYVVGCEL